MFLETDELEALTGYRRKADQRTQLGHMGIPFFTNRHGRPLVVREVLRQSCNTGKRKIDAMPDLDALRQMEDGS